MCLMQQHAHLRPPGFSNLIREGARVGGPHNDIQHTIHTVVHGGLWHLVSRAVLRPVQAQAVSAAKQVAATLA
jgi:hypothetical protein